MKKFILSIVILILLNSCQGYKPIFSGEDFNFYIIEKINKSDDNFSRSILKKLEPYSKINSENDKLKSISLTLNTELFEGIVSKDKKGDPLIFEIKILVNAEYLIDSRVILKKYQEKTLYNNQENKFDLNQYKNNILNNMNDKIYEKIILDLISL